MNQSQTKAPPMADGVHAPVPREQMHPSARLLRDTYAITPGLRIMRTEFGYYCLDEWKRQGLPPDVPFSQLFNYDPSGNHGLGQLGWCEAAFRPAFEDKVVADRGEYELVQDYAGRQVLFFKGRRDGFMPEYVNHPVKDMKTWEEDVKWRLDPRSPERYADLPKRMATAQAAAAQGMMIQQGLIGGYMYLRSLIGPEDLLYAFYDMPEVIHACMEQWFKLADAVIDKHQAHVTIDEIFFAEDICYNHGILISPDMMRRFLLPYYQQIITNLKRRQIDKARHLYVQIDTDGDCRPAIPVYREIGMDAMSPFEVASGCDVVEIGRRYPGLMIRGGIDKRVLAQGRPAIDEMLERIIPPLRRRGGYIPCCDHGVPAEVPYEDYLYYRKRCVELGG
ncbi:MAG: uroporphyrinogen decarboxylase family protein [Planctomycetota bacterium]